MSSRPTRKDIIIALRNLIAEAECSSDKRTRRSDALCKAKNVLLRETGGA